MILNVLKLGAAKRKLISLIEQRPMQRYQIPIKSIGLIIDFKNKNGIKDLQAIAKKFKIAKSNFNIVVVDESGTSLKGEKQIKTTWKGVNVKAEIIQEDLKTFISKEFDLLITFAEENNLLAHFVAASSSAGIKAGRYLKNQALYDVILQAEEDTAIFVEELSKYLKQLKLTADVQ